MIAEGKKGVCEFCKRAYEKKNKRQMFCTPNCQRGKLIELSNMKWFKKVNSQLPSRKGANSPPKLNKARDDS